MAEGEEGEHVQISTAPAVEPAMMDRRLLGCAMEVS